MSDDRDLDEDSGAGRGPSRIILPPGVTSVTEDVPEYPKLRPLILMPFVDGKRELILVQDPLGVIAGQPVLGMQLSDLLKGCSTARSRSRTSPPR